MTPKIARNIRTLLVHPEEVKDSKPSPWLNPFRITRWFEGGNGLEARARDQSII